MIIHPFLLLAALGFAREGVAALPDREKKRDTVLRRRRDNEMPPPPYDGVRLIYLNLAVTKACNL